MIVTFLGITTVSEFGTTSSDLNVVIYVIVQDELIS